jgi:hypothetical protein
LRHRVVLKQLGLIFVKNVVMREELIERLIVDPLWMELLVDPFVNAHRADFLDVTGSRSKRQPVQHVNDLLVGGELSMVEPSRCGSRG